MSAILFPQALVLKYHSAEPLVFFFHKHDFKTSAKQISEAHVALKIALSLS